jgi:hypothetical protein
MEEELRRSRNVTRLPRQLVSELPRGQKKKKRKLAKEKSGGRGNVVDLS